MIGSEKMNERDIAIISAMGGYAKMSKESLSKDKIIDNIENSLLKFMKKFKIPSNLDRKKSMELFACMKEIDFEFYREIRDDDDELVKAKAYSPSCNDDKDDEEKIFVVNPFNPFVVTLVMLDYLVNERRLLEFRTKFSHFPLRDIIDAIEKDKRLRRVIMAQHRILTLMIEVESKVPDNVQTDNKMYLAKCK